MAESTIKKHGYSIIPISLTPASIGAGTTQTFYNNSYKNSAVVGYALYGVASYNLAVTQLYCDSSGLIMVIKNNGSASVTPSSIIVMLLQE